MDLSALTLLSDRYYMFAEASTLGDLTTFLRSKSLRGRIEKVNRPGLPAAPSTFDGLVYALNDFVLDTPELLEAAAPRRERVFQHEVDAADYGARRRRRRDAGAPGAVCAQRRARKPARAVRRQRHAALLDNSTSKNRPCSCGRCTG